VRRSQSGRITFGRLKRLKQSRPNLIPDQEPEKCQGKNRTPNRERFKTVLPHGEGGGENTRIAQIYRENKTPMFKGLGKERTEVPHTTNQLKIKNRNSRGGQNTRGVGARLQG